MKFVRLSLFIFILININSYAGIPKDSTKFKEHLSFKDVGFLLFGFPFPSPKLPPMKLGLAVLASNVLL